MLPVKSTGRRTGRRLVCLQPGQEINFAAGEDKMALVPNHHIRWRRAQVKVVV